MNPTVLKIDKLCKNYGNLKALTNLSVEIKKGMVFGILGPNGSGKTTTLGILLGVLQSTSGEYSWFGKGDRDENRKRIGALLETPNFYPYLTAVQNLKIVAKIKRLGETSDRIERVLKAVSLHQRKDSEFRTFSLGMKQRLAIASALLSDPEVLVLDEPTNGLDPEGIAEIRALINQVSKEGTTILIASHQLDEIEKVCTDVLILKNGVTLRTSGINEIVGITRQITVNAEPKEKLVEVLKNTDFIKGIKEELNFFLLDVDEQISTADINQLCFDNGIVLNQLNEVQKSLEDQFLEIVKK